MKRMQDEPDNRDYANEKLSCRWCGGMETRLRLGLFGARCGRCFDGYKACMPDAPSVVGDKTKGPREWAYALKRREVELREPLTQAQRDAWRAAIGEQA
jgi:hypothetical protein